MKYAFSCFLPTAMCLRVLMVNIGLNLPILADSEKSLSYPPKFFKSQTEFLSYFQTRLEIYSKKCFK